MTPPNTVPIGFVSFGIMITRIARPSGSWLNPEPPSRSVAVSRAKLSSLWRYVSFALDQVKRVACLVALRCDTAILRPAQLGHRMTSI